MLFAAGLPRLFATHPSLEERLKALDPSFRASELPARAAEAARAAHAPAPGRCDAVDAPARPAAAARRVRRRARPLAALASEAAAIAAQAGTIATEQVRYARAGARVDPGRRARVRRLRRSRARAHAGIAGEQGAGGAATPSAACSKRPTAPSSARTCSRSAPSPMRSRRRCACRPCSSCFPSLRRLSLGERQKLRDVVGRLALADSRIDVFECCLTLLLASSLYDELEAGAQHGSASLLQEIDAIHVLFCVLAAQGASRRRARRRVPTKPASRWCCPNTGRRFATSMSGPRRCAMRWRAWCTCGRSRRRCSSKAWSAASRTIARCRWRKASCCARCARCCIVRCRPFSDRQG